MLTSLLSLYITGIIDTNLGAQINTETVTDTHNIVRTASFDYQSISEATSIPVKDHAMVSPIINANGSIGVDLKTGGILFEKNPHERLPIASITKLMTILIILEENDLTETVKVSGNASTVGGSTMYLRTGETISVKATLLGALVNSANDAATALAEHNAGSVDEFVKKMNRKALSLGLVNTRFANPMGLDNPNNYSSAYDIAKLSKYIYQKEFVRNAAILRDVEVQSESGEYTHKLKSTNTLLGNEHYNVKGLKTGRTDGAGLCLVSVSENNDGNEIITVVLGSPARFQETKVLIDWIFRAYTW